MARSKYSSSASSSSSVASSSSSRHAPLSSSIQSQQQQSRQPSNPKNNPSSSIIQPTKRGPHLYAQRGGYAPPPPPGTNSSSSKTPGSNAPLFSSSSFPTALPPRRPKPLHYDNPATSAGSARHHPSPSIKFRSAESTQRTMNELAQKRYESMEKKRAGSLLIFLVCFAVGVHFITSETTMAHSGFFGMGNEGSGFQSLRSKEYSLAGSGAGGDDAEVEETDGGGGKVSSELLLLNENEANNNQGEETSAQKEYDDEDYLPDLVEEEYAEGEEYLMPLRYYADIKAPRRRSDSPFFFHIPRSGGQTLKDIVGKCLGLVQATNMGITEGHADDPDLAVVNLKDARYVNVDTTSLFGLERSARLGLSKSKLADMITSSLFHDASSLFELYYQGRAFTMLRHPVERTVSMYYYRTRGEHADIDASISIEEYAQGKGIENNWVTRFLTNTMEGELTKEHLDQAMEILGRKFLIGFLDDGEESIARMMKYFGWSYSTDPTKKMLQEDCVSELITDGTNVNVDGYEVPKKGTQAYALIVWQTQFDIKLYEYAKELFDAQTKHWGTKARKKMMKKKKGGK